MAKESPRLCVICGARVRNLNPRATVCGGICYEKKRIQEGARVVECCTCGQPALVRFGITTEVHCAECAHALGESLSLEMPEV